MGFSLLEWILLALVAWATWIAAARAAGGDASARGVRTTVGVTVLIGFLGAAGWTYARGARIQHFTEVRAAVPSQGRPGGYVSSDACQSCHPGEYQSWHRTFHRTMTQYASPESVLGDFNEVKLEWRGERYRMFRRDGEFWAEMPDPEESAPGLRVDAAGRLIPSTATHRRVESRIGLLTGSHHMQIYWTSYAKGNRQRIFPFAWLKEDHRWAPVDATFLRDPTLPSANQSWNANCISCHATAGQPRPDLRSDEYATRTAELGISCEACHGPGEEHIRRYSSPITRYLTHGSKPADTGMTHPPHLDRVKSSQACGQCHGIKWIPAAENYPENGFSFRPGADLQTSTPIVQPSKLAELKWLQDALRNSSKYLEEHYWSDGEVRVSGRDYNGMIDSPCYQRGSLTCFSCHSLHTSDPNNQLAAHRESNEACLQCHTTMRDRVPAHTHHAAGSPGNECYNCHMPHTTYGLLKGIRSHRITSPRVDITLKTGRPNACNLCHLDKTLAWTATQLNTWYGQLEPRLGPEQQTVSAAVLWMTRGDAGQRALVAYAAGLENARHASGERWLAPALAPLLDDPYPAVRYIAGRSLKRLPGFARMEYDFVGPEADRTRARRTALDLWNAAGSPDRTGPAVLINAAGEPDTAAREALLRQRDDHSMDLQE